MAAHERIVIEEDEYGRLLVEREPAPVLVIWRGCGPERGEYEDQRSTPAAEYIPPRRAA